MINKTNRCIIQPIRKQISVKEAIAKALKANEQEDNGMRTMPDNSNSEGNSNSDTNQNTSSQPAIPGSFEEYYGRNVDKAPEILKAGKIIAPFFYIAQKRIASATPEETAQWADKWYDTSDLIAYASQGNNDNNEVKVVMPYDNNFRITDAGKFCLELINPSEALVNNAVNLSNGRYEKIKGKGVAALKRNALAKFLNEGMLKPQALDSRLWRILLRHEDEVESDFAVRGLHKDYIDWAYGSYKDRFAKNSSINELKIMGVYPDSAGDVPKLGAWYVGGLDNGSNAYGRCGLDYGRLVGLAPEAPLDAP